MLLLRGNKTGTRHKQRLPQSLPRALLLHHSRPNSQAAWLLALLPSQVAYRKINTIRITWRKEGEDSKLEIWRTPTHHLPFHHLQPPTRLELPRQSVTKILTATEAQLSIKVQQGRDQGAGQQAPSVQAAWVLKNIIGHIHKRDKILPAKTTVSLETSS